MKSRDILSPSQSSSTPITISAPAETLEPLYRAIADAEYDVANRTSHPAGDIPTTTSPFADPVAPGSHSGLRAAGRSSAHEYQAEPEPRAGSSSVRAPVPVPGSELRRVETLPRYQPSDIDDDDLYASNPNPIPAHAEQNGFPLEKQSPPAVTLESWSGVGGRQDPPAPALGTDATVDHAPSPNPAPAQLGPNGFPLEK